MYIRKELKRTGYVFIFFFLFALIFSGCERNELYDKTQKALISITISSPSASIVVNEKLQFTATGTYADQTTKDITETVAWKSNNKSVAKINDTGAATGAAPGNAAVSAELSGISSENSSGSVSLTVSLQVAFYVSQASGSDSTGIGTQTNPYQTITKALDSAPAGAAVLVNGGTYAENIILKNEVPIYGSYSSNFGSRNLDATPSIIAPSSGAPVLGNTALNDKTILNGFDIKGAKISGTLSVGIKLESGASPIIENNKIYGGTSSQDSFGIHIDNSYPLIQKNHRIDGGASPSSAYGIFFDNGDGTQMTIRNNCIFGGDGSSSYGIFILVNGSVAILNNTISSGKASGKQHGIHLSGSSASIQNNLIFSFDKIPGSYGVYEASAASNPSYFLNNNIALNSFNMLYFDNGTTDRNDITDLNATSPATSPASNNLAEDLNGLFVNDDTDWHLDPTKNPPSSIRNGGLDLSAISADTSLSLFSDDLDGTTRTLWTIGAYEYRD
ncbi:MAG: DUF1565 domain-containing protein [bacterium]|nr:DUF1565 domain-containing protein [bacterium]